MRTNATDDAPGVCAQALQEMLLQSQGDIIRLAPAWPVKWPAQYRLLARGGFAVTAEVCQGAARYALIESTRGGRCRVANPWPDAAVVSCAGKRLLSTTAPLLEFDTAAGRTYRLERASVPLAKLQYAPLRPAPAAGPRWIGKRLPLWPHWTSPASLGIDAEGRTPQRAAMLRAVEGFRTRLAEATAGLSDLSTGKAQVTITRGKESPLPAPALTAGGPPAPVDVPDQECVLLDLGAERTVSAVAFSRDRTGLFVDAPATGYTIEGSPDGKEWQMLADRAKTAAAPAGQVETFPAALARYVRLRLWGQYNGAVRLDGVLVYGK